MPDTALLAAYDAELRAEGEVAGMGAVHRIGPLWLASPTPTSGFVTYGPLPDVDRSSLAELVTRVQDWFSVRGTTEVEWKTRGHDPGFAPSSEAGSRELADTLVAHGFLPDDPETVVAGRAQALSGPGVVQGAVVRRAGDGGLLTDDVVRAVALQDLVFERGMPGMADRLLTRVMAGETQLWLVEADGVVVGAGRIDPVPGTGFAGLWGGAVRADWRGRGVYRALTQARAAAAVSRGLDRLYADCTEMSRPILERCGLVAITTTTPYVWRPA